MTSKFVSQFLDFVRTNHLAQMGQKTLLAVSGGMDSTAMAHLFHTCNYPFGIAHCNFQLRGSDSNQDADFVKNMALEFEVPFYRVEFDAAQHASEQKLSIQEAARDLRYQWLETIRAKNDFTFVAVAHHLNDQVETVLHNMIKGTGIRGLSGMKVKRNKIIRPLLFAYKEEIISYTKDNNIQFREDASNKESKYTRNKIRKEVIPALKQINSGFTSSFVESIKHFQDIETIYKASIQTHSKKLVQKKNGEVQIPVNLLLKLEARSTILYEIIKGYGFTGRQVIQIVESLSKQSGKLFMSRDYRLIKDRKFLIISPKVHPDSSIKLLDKHDTNLTFAEKKLMVKRFDKAGEAFPRDTNSAWLDAKKLAFPMVVRKWKKGDYFYPLGMTRKGKNKVGKKKISDFLTDLKLPLHKKSEVRVLVSDKKIAWVIGYRIDDRFKITEQTKSVFQLKLTE